jgi:hypothetical protein
MDHNAGKPPVVDIKIKSSPQKREEITPRKEHTLLNSPQNYYYIHPVTNVSPEILEAQHKALLQ